jgi:DNA-binding transcriptional regulator YiaG
MGADEYRVALATLELSQHGLARMVGVSPRTGHKWGLGEARIPGCVALLLRLLLARPELMAVIENMGRPPVRERSLRG